MKARVFWRIAQRSLCDDFAILVISLLDGNRRILEIAINIIHGMHSAQQKKEMFMVPESIFALQWSGKDHTQSKRETTDCPNILTINNQMIERSSRCQIDRLIEIATQPDTICHLLIIKMTTDNVFLSAANYSMLMFSTTIWRRLHSYTLLLRHRGHEQYALVAQWLPVTFGPIWPSWAIRPNLLFWAGPAGRKMAQMAHRWPTCVECRYVATAVHHSEPVCC